MSQRRPQCFCRRNGLQLEFLGLKHSFSHPAGGQTHGRPVSLQAFESTLKSWEDKQKGEGYRGSPRPRLSSQQSMEYLTEEEFVQLQRLAQATDTLIDRYLTLGPGGRAGEGWG